MPLRLLKKVRRARQDSRCCAIFFLVFFFGQLLSWKQVVSWLSHLHNIKGLMQMRKDRRQEHFLLRVCIYTVYK